MQAFWRFAFVFSAIVAATLIPVKGQAPALNSSDFFNPMVLQRVDLWVNSTDWEKLKQEFQTNEYYPANLIWNGITVQNIGIRSRGLGSRSGTKPGLRVDMDRYTSSQSFLGLKSFVLDNLTQDPSAIRETTAMQVYNRMNIPAPREAHARLYVNGNYAGLYAVVESIDKAFLARVFGSIGDDTQNDGHLYEYKYTQPWFFNYLGSDLAPYKQIFEAKTHENQSDAQLYGPIENVVRLVNEVPSEQFMASLNEHLDLHAFIRYMAVQNFLGQNDGFVGYAGMNNFYFYRKENSPTHVFLAWDEDTAFWGPEYGLQTRHEENVLMRKAMAVPELSALYFATLLEAAHLAETPEQGAEIGWLEQEVRRQLDLVNASLNEDPYKPYSMEEHDGSRNLMLLCATQRSRYVESQIQQQQQQLQQRQRRP